MRPIMKATAAGCCLLASLCLGVSRGQAATRFVWTNSPSAGPPYDTWSNAAHAIQEAVDYASSGDTVLVTSGTYRLTTQISVTKGIEIRSVNGPACTAVDGSAATRCFYVSHSNACVEGLTLTNGTALTGGGVLLDTNGTVSRCVIVGNSASNGGGAYCSKGGILRDCVIRGNVADLAGGGVFLDGYAFFFDCTVRNCLIISNVAARGGGLELGYGGTVENCTITRNSATNLAGGLECYYAGYARNTIIQHNQAPLAPNVSNTGGYVPTYSHCCLLPFPEPYLDAGGNITNDPEFASLAEGDFHLSINSPCVDSGTNLVAVTGDLDGVPRPLDGNGDGTNGWDMGAYEFVHPTADSDADRMRDYAETLAGTDPTNRDSFLGLTFVSRPQEGAGIVLGWSSVNGKRYRLMRSTNLLNDAFGYPVRTNIVGTAPVNTETDTTAVGVGPWHYKIELE